MHSIQGMSEIRQVTDENYQEVFRARRVLLVAYARTCPDSMRMVEKALPEFMKTSGEGESGTAIAIAPIRTLLNKPDLENPKLAEWLGIEQYPTLYLIADGKIVDRKPSEGSVEEQIKDLQTALHGK